MPGAFVNKILPFPHEVNKMILDKVHRTFMIHHPVLATLPCVQIEEQEGWRVVINTQAGDHYETVDAQLLYSICAAKLLFREFTLEEMIASVEDGVLETAISDNGDGSDMAINAKRIMEDKAAVCKAFLRKFALKKEGEGTWRALQAAEDAQKGMCQQGGKSGFKCVVQ